MQDFIEIIDRRGNDQEVFQVSDVTYLISVCYSLKRRLVFNGGTPFAAVKVTSVFILPSRRKVAKTVPCCKA